MTSLVPRLTLNDGRSIPQLGFGVWRVENDQAVEVVTTALETGYRHIDTAAAYRNEVGVGKAIAASGIPRDQLWVTTKLWNDQHKAADARKGVEQSLERLGLDYLDLFLIHWPSAIAHPDEYVEAWDAFQEFRAEGLVKSIGVSNFHVQHLDKLRGETPAIDQVEIHPSLTQESLRAALDDRDIQPEAWSPLGQARDLTNPVICSIAQELGVTPAQAVIRWHLQLGTVVIPKSVTPERIRSNFDVFGFELTGVQMERISGLDAGDRIGADPDTASF